MLPHELSDYGLDGTGGLLGTGGGGAGLAGAFGRLQLNKSSSAHELVL